MTEGNNPLITRLVAAHHRRDSDLTSIRRWTYPQVTGPMTRLAGDHGWDEYCAAAITATAFATWHAGRSTVHKGKADTSLGRALRQLGNPGARGPQDPRARRLIDQILSASTGDQLHRAVGNAITALKGDNHPPNWALLHQHILAWMNPSTRPRVLLAWGQDFATSAPTTNEK